MPKFKLNVLERLTLMQLLPREGSFVTLKIIRDTNSVLGLNDAEFKEFNVTQEKNEVKWNNKGNQEKEIELGDKATELVIQAFKKLDEEKKLEQKHFSLFKKFVKEET